MLLLLHLRHDRRGFGHGLLEPGVGGPGIAGRLPLHDALLGDLQLHSHLLHGLIGLRLRQLHRTGRRRRGDRFPLGGGLRVAGLHSRGGLLLDVGRRRRQGRRRLRKQVVAHRQVLVSGLEELLRAGHPFGGGGHLSRQPGHGRAQALVAAQFCHLLSPRLPEAGQLVLSHGRYPRPIGTHRHPGHRASVGILRDHLPVSETDPPGHAVGAAGQHLSTFSREAGHGRHRSPMDRILVEPRHRSAGHHLPAPGTVSRRRQHPLGPFRPGVASLPGHHTGQMRHRLGMAGEPLEEHTGGGVVDHHGRLASGDRGDDPCPVVRPGERRHLPAEVADPVDAEGGSPRLPEAQRSIRAPSGEGLLVGHRQRADRDAMAGREHPLPRLDLIAADRSVDGRGNHLLAAAEERQATHPLLAPFEVPGEAEVSGQQPTISTDGQGGGLRAVEEQAELRRFRHYRLVDRLGEARGRDIPEKRPFAPTVTFERHQSLAIAGQANGDDRRGMAGERLLDLTIGQGMGADELVLAGSHQRVAIGRQPKRRRRRGEIPRRSRAGLGDIPDLDRPVGADRPGLIARQETGRKDLPGMPREILARHAVGHGPGAEHRIGPCRHHERHIGADGDGGHRTPRLETTDRRGRGIRPIGEPDDPISAPRNHPPAVGREGERRRSPLVARQRGRDQTPFESDDTDHRLPVEAPGQGHEPAGGMMGKDRYRSHVRRHRRPARGILPDPPQRRLTILETGGKSLSIAASRQRCHLRRCRAPPALDPPLPAGSLRRRRDEREQAVA